MTLPYSSVTVAAHARAPVFTDLCSIGRNFRGRHLISLAGYYPGRRYPPKTIEPIQIVVTIPVLKDLTEQVGGAHVHVLSLLSGLENEHTYSPKPSDIIAVRKARLLVEIGVGLEVWVSALVKNAGSPSLRVITTSKGIGLIRDSGREDGQQAEDDQHDGNPHIWLDPENAKIMLRHITEALIKVDPPHASEYRDNQAAYFGNSINCRPTCLSD